MNAEINEYHFRNNEIEKQLARIDSIYHNRSASFTDLTHTPKGKFSKAKTKQFIAEMLKLIKDADSHMPTKLYSESFEQFCTSFLYLAVRIISSNYMDYDKNTAPKGTFQEILNLARELESETRDEEDFHLQYEVGIFFPAGFFYYLYYYYPFMDPSGKLYAFPPILPGETEKADALYYTAQSIQKLYEDYTIPDDELAELEYDLAHGIYPEEIPPEVEAHYKVVAEREDELVNFPDKEDFIKNGMTVRELFFKECPMGSLFSDRIKEAIDIYLMVHGKCLLADEENYLDMFTETELLIDSLRKIVKKEGK